MYVLTVEGSQPITLADWFSVLSHINLMTYVVDGFDNLPPFEIERVH